MKRELGIFPYSPDTFQAPRTTGLIGGTRNTELSLSVPNNETFYTRPKLRGSIMGSYISPTTPCIDTNTTWHPIFAGDFQKEYQVAHYTYKEEEILAKHTIHGLLRYKDPNAFFCKNCDCTYGVECPKCGIKSPVDHIKTQDTFVVRRPLEIQIHEGFKWTKVTCGKCDYSFRVIVL